MNSQFAIWNPLSDSFTNSEPRSRSGFHAERWAGATGFELSEPLAGDMGIVKGDNAIGEDLVGMAAFAGDQHGIASAGVGQGGLDGLAAVGLDADLARPPEPGQESSRIWLGSSVRGLLMVRMTRSAPASAASASRRRSVRSPPPSALRRQCTAGPHGPHGGQGLFQGRRASSRR